MARIVPLVNRLIGFWLVRLRAHKLVTKKQIKYSGTEGIFVHTMGKVGSSTIWRLLHDQALTLTYPCYWTHFLSSEGGAFYRKLQQRGYGDRPIPLNRRCAVENNRARGWHLRHGLLKRQRHKVITLVRDPVAVNVAGFFQNHAWWPDELREAVKNGGEYLVRLSNAFITDYPHHVPINWFETELKGVFGIDVFDKPFPVPRGYAIHRGDRADVLVMRLESLDHCFGAALKDFLDIDVQSIPDENRGDKKWYSEAYQRFKREVILPPWYLSDMYSSRYAKHFYTEEELTLFRSRWSGERKRSTAMETKSKELLQAATDSSNGKVIC